ncbi:hypothetical protein O181_004509 [Austropuccinia psidii MF-1]|uniref:Uncharacterized protein n=1 Tax=Austropuccinia psidii MF-1 TaxID=1389203 RepID=A0A9Q3BGC4_9BASI|nr:hypothetical protein [Austropuccinia psidii MF-1]
MGPSPNPKNAPSASSPKASFGQTAFASLRKLSWTRKRDHGTKTQKILIPDKLPHLKFHFPVPTLGRMSFEQRSPSPFTKASSMSRGPLCASTNGSYPKVPLQPSIHKEFHLLGTLPQQDASSSQTSMEELRPSVQLASRDFRHIQPIQSVLPPIGSDLIDSTHAHTRPQRSNSTLEFYPLKPASRSRTSKTTTASHTSHFPKTRYEELIGMAFSPRFNSTKPIAVAQITLENTEPAKGSNLTYAGQTTVFPEANISHQASKNAPESGLIKPDAPLRRSKSSPTSSTSRVAKDSQGERSAMMTSHELTSTQPTLLSPMDLGDTQLIQIIAGRNGQNVMNCPKPPITPQRSKLTLDFHPLKPPFRLGRSKTINKSYHSPLAQNRQSGLFHMVSPSCLNFTKPILSLQTDLSCAEFIKTKVSANTFKPMLSSEAGIGTQEFKNASNRSLPSQPSSALRRSKSSISGALTSPQYPQDKRSVIMFPNGSTPIQPTLSFQTDVRRLNSMETIFHSHSSKARECPTTTRPPPRTKLTGDFHPLKPASRLRRSKTTATLHIPPLAKHDYRKRFAIGSTTQPNSAGPLECNVISSGPKTLAQGYPQSNHLTTNNITFGQMVQKSLGRSPEKGYQSKSQATFSGNTSRMPTLDSFPKLEAGLKSKVNDPTCSTSLPSPSFPNLSLPLQSASAWDSMDAQIFGVPFRKDITSEPEPLGKEAAKSQASLTIQKGDISFYKPARSLPEISSHTNPFDTIPTFNRTELTSFCDFKQHQTAFKSLSQSQSQSRDACSRNQPQSLALCRPQRTSFFLSISREKASEYTIQHHTAQSSRGGPLSVVTSSPSRKSTSDFDNSLVHSVKSNDFVCPEVSDGSRDCTNEVLHKRCMRNFDVDPRSWISGTDEDESTDSNSGSEMEHSDDDLKSYQVLIGTPVHLSQTSLKLLPLSN